MVLLQDPPPKKRTLNGPDWTDVAHHSKARRLAGLVTKSLERGDSLFLRARTEDLTVIKGAVEEVQTDCAD